MHVKRYSFRSFLLYSMVPGVAQPQPGMDMKRCFFRSCLINYMVLGPAQRPGLAGQIPSLLASFLECPLHHIHRKHVVNTMFERLQR